jgi:outer membrane immunogenic protein
MRLSILAGIATVFAPIAIGPAVAADIPMRAPAAPIMAPAFNWTGFYIGGNVGYHWDRDEVTTAANPVGWTVAGAAAINGVTGGSVNPRGIMGGGQIGYNWQVGSNFLLGFEADANALAGTSSRLVTNFTVINPADVFTTSAQSTFLATVRGRAGFAADRVLFYVTGGLAVGTVKFADSFGSFGNTDIASVNTSSTRTGWTAGGGIEWAFDNNWSVKAEYLYVDLGRTSTLIPSCTTCAIGSDIGVNHRYTESIARLGVNYRFGGGPVVARY